MPSEHQFPRGPYAANKINHKCNEKQDGAPAKFQKRPKVFLVMFSFVSYVGVTFFSRFLFKWEPKWHHNDDKMMSLTPFWPLAIPKAAQSVENPEEECQLPPVNPPLESQLGGKMVRSFVSKLEKIWKWLREGIWQTFAIFKGFYFDLGGFCEALGMKKTVKTV